MAKHKTSAREMLLKRAPTTWTDKGWCWRRTPLFRMLASLGVGADFVKERAAHSTALLQPTHPMLQARRYSAPDALEAAPERRQLDRFFYQEDNLWISVSLSSNA